MLRYYTLLLTFLPLCLPAQDIKNVRLLQEGGTLLVLYDLWPGSQSAAYEASLYYSFDEGSSFRGPARQLSGAVGPVQPGPNLQIRWQVREEIGPFLIDQFQVEVRVRVLPGALPEPILIQTPTGEKPKTTPPKSFDFVSEMVRVEGGSFSMGSKDGYHSEKPVHTVRLQSFEIGKYEVTQKEWAAVMGDNPSRFNCEECPVEQVSWNRVQTYIRKLNEKTGLSYRLPTEAEWEYAAKGGQYSLGQTYAGSNWPEQVAWYLDNSDSKTHPVGQKEPNELGLYDMSGNVWEWCQDRWHSSYKGAPTDGSAWESGTSSPRVLRGGSWSNGPARLRVSNRGRNDPGVRGDLVGFRLARTL